MRRALEASVLLLACTFARATSKVDSGVRLVVSTESGQVAGQINGSIYQTSCGFTKYFSGHDGAPNVAAFLGIPYGAAPVGDLRFRPTAARKPWTEVLEASKPGPVCPQLPLVSLAKIPGFLWSVNEDCLYLNVWAPTSTSGAVVGTALPTILFLHGGCFMTGSGYQEVDCAFYNAQGLASDTNTVIVTINYRLGVFGFFSDPQLLAESGTTGNYGLQDQRFAMTWVKNNIAAFGGDPARVTLMGESAGAASTLHHLVLPRSVDLFAKAISQSGYDLTWSLESAYARDENISKAVGCSNTASRLQCLRKLTAKEVLMGQESFFFKPDFNWLQRALVYGPVSDGFELPTDKSFATVLSEAKIDKPVLIGSNLNETNLLFCLEDKLKKEIATWEHASAFLIQQVRLHVPESPATDAEVQMFFDHYRNFPTPLGAVMASLTDFMFACPARRVAGFLTRANVSAYRFLFARAPKAMQADSCLGVPHAADLLMLFSKAFPSSANPYLIGDATEQALAAAMVKAWGSFAWHGSPEAGLSWPRWNSSEPTLQLGLRTEADQQLTRVLQGYQAEACKVVDEVIQPNGQRQAASVVV